MRRGIEQLALRGDVEEGFVGWSVARWLVQLNLIFSSRIRSGLSSTLSAVAHVVVIIWIVKWYLLTEVKPAEIAAGNASMQVPRELNAFFGTQVLHAKTSVPRFRSKVLKKRVQKSDIASPQVLPM